MRSVLLLWLCIIPFFLKGQEPYIQSGPGDGLGQYGYLELDNITFTRLNRNTFGNVRLLKSRWFVTDNNAGTNGGGQEYIYSVEDGSEWPTCVTWQCSGCMSSSLTTDNYDASHFNGEFVVGADAYVSVYSTFCDFSERYCCGQTGDNERHFQVVDFDNSVNTNIEATVGDGDGSCGTNSIVGGFTLNASGISGAELDRLFFMNTGTAQEGTDLPNTAFILYYEAVTGSESFDGTESSVQLYGDWGGDATDNEVFGAENMNIPITSDTRFYVALCDINSSGIGKTVQLSTLNDGLSIGPGNDGFTGLRMGETSISASSVLLPVELISFESMKIDDHINLYWRTASEVNNKYFGIERSTNAITWEEIGQKHGYGTTQTERQYEFLDEFPDQHNYYRLKQVDYDGQYTYSSILYVKMDGLSESKHSYLTPNPVNDWLTIVDQNSIGHIEIYDISGKQVMLSRSSVIDVSQISSGVYLIRVLDQDNNLVDVQRVIKN